MNIANFIGREGFNWWIGQVENDGAKFWNAELEDGNGDFDYGDWDWTNKVKVRIIGYHNPNRKELPTRDLPWAQVLMPPNIFTTFWYWIHTSTTTQQLGCWILYGWYICTNSYCYGVNQ